MSKEEINIFEIYVELFNCKKIKNGFIREQKFEKAAEYRDLEREIHNKLQKFIDFPDIESYFLKYDIDIRNDMSVFQIIREVKLYHLLN